MNRVLPYVIIKRSEFEIQGTSLGRRGASEHFKLYIEYIQNKTIITSLKYYGKTVSLFLHENSVQINYSYLSFRELISNLLQC